MTDNTRYFVKSHFNGWCEVGYENYKAFIENIAKHATGIPSNKKQEYISKVTKVIQTERGSVKLPKGEREV